MGCREITRGGNLQRGKSLKAEQCSSAFWLRARKQCGLVLGLGSEGEPLQAVLAEGQELRFSLYKVSPKRYVIRKYSGPI